ncbi:MAG: sugar phosphate isomerase/epimerase [Planctomycetes bacterium]|nr:sugar phosphate isomerase/epimerase [Planctomycetota bacterium]
MKIGMNLFLWTGQATLEAAPVIQQLAKMGFDGIEFPIFHQNEEVYRELRKLLDDLGLGATGCSVVSNDANPIGETPEVRRKGIDHLKRVLDMCAILKCDVLCGPVCSPVGRLVGRGRTEEEWNWAVEALREVGDHAQAAGVTVAVEYLNRFETYFINIAADTRKLIQAVGKPAIRMMMDTFHSNIEEKDPYRAWKGCGKLLAHVHISENDRGVPGSGQVAWKEVFKALKEIKYDRWLTIESFGTTVPEIANAASIWRKLFPSNEAVARGGIKFIKKMIGRKK